MIQRFVLLAGLVLALEGCSMNGVPDYQHDWDALIQKGLPSEASFRELSERYPGHWELPLSMGIASLANGQRDLASKYLQDAQRQKPLWASQDQSYLLYSGLAQVAYDHGDWNQAIVEADRAIPLSAKEPLGNRLIKARSLFLLGKKSDARSLFDQVWKANVEVFSRESFQAYFSLAAEAAQWSLALEILDREIRAVGYQSGMGLKYSQVLEHLNRWSESLLAAYFDLRGERYRGAVTTEAILRNLDTLEKQLASQVDPNQWRPTLTAIRQWEVGKPATPALNGDADFPFLAYFRLLDVVRPGQTQPLPELAKWEPVFVAVPEYSRLYANALKYRQTGYTFETVRPFLEKAILLGGPFPQGAESRAELGVLLDLPAEEGRKLLLPAELQSMAVALGATRNVQLLGPAADMLELRNNPYSDIAVTFLRTLAAQDGATRKYLQERQAHAPALSQSKYRSVLNG